MTAASHGYVDFGPQGFFAQFEHEPAIAARIEAIQRRRWDDDRKCWIVPEHWPSVRQLLHIASEQRWRITPAARQAEQRVRSHGESLEYTIDVVHDKHGQMEFQCRVGDDDVLRERIKALPGAYWDDCFCVPTDWERCCGPLLEIYESDERIECSVAALQMLTEPDVAHLYLRTSAPPLPATRTIDAGLLPTTAAQPWAKTDEDRERQARSSATRADDFSISPRFRGTLHPFQVTGVRYLLETKRAFLADEMGLGKTIQTLATLETAGAYPALVLCPPHLMNMWWMEARRWLPTSRRVATFRSGSAIPEAEVLIVGYSSLPQHKEQLTQCAFAAIVADESHYLKNRESKRTEAALAIASTCMGLRFCLSGTPMPNQPLELATQLEFLGRLDSDFGGFWRFAERYCAPQHTDYGVVFGANNLEELGPRLRALGFCRREKAAVLPQLPLKSRHIERIALEDPAAYERVWRESLERLRALARHSPELDEELVERRAREKKRTRAYLGVIQGVLHESGRQKIAAVARWISHFVERDEPLVVFAHHLDVIAALKRHFPQAALITGNEAVLDRERAVRDFQDGKTQLMLCSLSVASVGMTLTRAASLAFAEVSWKAAEHMQAEDRVHRIGQHRAVRVTYLVAQTALEEIVLRAIERKRGQSEHVNESALQEICAALAAGLRRDRKSRVTRRAAVRERAASEAVMPARRPQTPHS